MSTSHFHMFPASPMSMAVILTQKDLVKAMRSGTETNCKDKMVFFLNNVRLWLTFYGDSGNDEKVLLERSKVVNETRKLFPDAKNPHTGQYAFDYLTSAKTDNALPAEQSSTWVFQIVSGFIQPSNVNTHRQYLVYENVCTFFEEVAETYGLRSEIMNSLLGGAWEYITEALTEKDPKLREPASRLAKVLCKEVALSPQLALKLVESRVKTSDYSSEGLQAFRRQHIDFLNSVANRCVDMGEHVALATTCFEVCLKELQLSQDAEPLPAMKDLIGTYVSRLEKRLKQVEA